MSAAFQGQQDAHRAPADEEEIASGIPALEVSAATEGTTIDLGKAGR